MTPTTHVACNSIPALEEAISAAPSRIKGVHHECSSVPMPSQHDFDRLVESIRKHGLLRPVEIDKNGLLLDGRLRLLASLVAGVKLGDRDIVITAVDPAVIAASNNPRRHLTPDQTAMEAARLLQDERKLAAERRKEGGAKGRNSQKCSPGTDSVPSETAAKKRALRATDRIAAENGVSRDQLTLSDKVFQADPEIAEKVRNGTISLKAAAKQAGVEIMPARKAIPATPAKAKRTGNKILLRDDYTEVIDTPEGIRIVRCDTTTYLLCKATRQDGHVGPFENGWTWWIGDDVRFECVPGREAAEKLVLAALASK